MTFVTLVFAKLIKHLPSKARNIITRINMNYMMDRGNQNQQGESSSVFSRDWTKWSKLEKIVVTGTVINFILFLILIAALIILMLSYAKCK